LSRWQRRIQNDSGTTNDFNGFRGAVLEKIGPFYSDQGAHSSTGHWPVLVIFWHARSHCSRPAGEQRSDGPKEEFCVKAIVGAVLALSATAAFAEPLPVSKPPGPSGSCPHGYLASGSYCVPSRGAADAIAKPPNGTCPWGWLASGSYCLRSGSGGR